MNLEALKADTIRKRGTYKLRYVISGYFTDRTFRPLITMRLCQSSRNWQFGKPLHLLFRLMHRSACNRAGIDLLQMQAAVPMAAIDVGSPGLVGFLVLD